MSQYIDEQLLSLTPQQLVARLPEKVSTPLFEHAERRPDAAAVRDQLGRALTYQALADEVRMAMKRLQAEHVIAGDRVVLVNENCVPLLVLILALSELGVWPVVVNARMSAAEVGRIVDHCQPRLVLYFGDSEAAVAQWRRVMAADRDSRSCEVLTVAEGEVFILRRASTEVVDSTEKAAQAEKDVFTLVYTTGTTGDPKGVMLSHRNVLYVAAVGGALRGLSVTDRIYLVLPVSHVFGLSAVFLASIYVGAELILADRFDAGTALQVMKSTGVTGLFGVPTIFAKLVDHARRQGLGEQDIPGLRFMYSGGAPLDMTIKRMAEELFRRPLLNGYGMTESASTICQVRCYETTEDSSVGRPLPGLDIRIVDSEGKRVAAGEVGELHVRGPNVMLGYFCNPEATAAAIDPDGFLNTGDLVRLDEQGVVHIAGRSKELIIHSGFNVYPPEVEAAILSHPEVLLCAVVGCPVEGNEEVVAYIQCVAGGHLDEAELREFIRPRLTAYKRPMRFLFMDSLPTSPSGKVLKHKLTTSVEID